MKRMQDTNHMRLLMEAFHRGDELSAADAAEISYITPQMARQYLRWLLGNRRIHITRWEINRSTWYAVYALGAKRSARKPAPATDAARSKASRLAKRKPKSDPLTRIFFTSLK